MTDTSKRPVSPVNGQPLPCGKPFEPGERAREIGRNGGRNSQKTITLRGLVTALTGEIAWMRIYPGGWRAPPMELHDWDAITDAVRAFGDCPVRTIMPGYRFVIVVLD